MIRSGFLLRSNGSGGVAGFNPPASKQRGGKARATHHERARFGNGPTDSIDLNQEWRFR